MRLFVLWAVPLAVGIGGSLVSSWEDAEEKRRVAVEAIGRAQAALDAWAECEQRNRQGTTVINVATDSLGMCTKLLERCRDASR